MTSVFVMRESTVKLNKRLILATMITHAVNKSLSQPTKEKRKVFYADERLCR
jgi:hypothetical protein